MLLDIEWLAHDRYRIHRGMFAKRDRHGGKRAAVGVVTLEIAACDHRGARAWRGHAVNRILAMPTAGLAATFAIPTASHHRTPHAREADGREARDRIGESGVDKHRGPLDAARG